MAGDDESEDGSEPGDAESEAEDSEPIDDPEARALANTPWGGVDLTRIPDVQAGAAVHAATVAASADAALAPDVLARAWTGLGPRNLGGAVREITQDPNNLSTFYAGTAAGGAWKSVNEGLSWEPLGGPGDVFPVAAIAVARGDSRLVYMGTGERDLLDAGGQGLFVSTDAGRHFTRIAQRGAAAPGDGNHYARIALDPLARPLAGAGQVTVAGLTLTRVGAQNLTTEFSAFDLIEIGSEVRVVMAVTASTVTLDRVFDSPPAVATAYRRMSRRFWVANERGLFRFDPGAGFVAEGPFPRLGAGAAFPNRRATDVRVVPAPGAPNDLVVYVGLHALGLWRGLFTHGPPIAMAWAQCRRSTGATVNVFPNPFGRVLVTISGLHVYTIAETTNAAGASQLVPSHLFRSTTLGNVFTQRQRPFTSGGGGLERALGWYCMLLEADPGNDQQVLFGQVHLWRTGNGGNTWSRINSGTQFHIGFRGQHEDQHAALWDARPPAGAQHRLWVGHDGGLGVTTIFPGAPNFTGWRKRDFSVVCGQFYALGVHPQFPFMTGGGLQDGGTWMSYGGHSWYQLISGDGGALAFRTDPRQVLTSSQDGPARIQIAPAGAPDFRSPMPDATPATTLRTSMQAGTGAIAAAAPFVGVVEGHPTVDGEILIGRMSRVFRTTNGGASFTGLNPQAPANAMVTAIAFIPSQPLAPAQPVFWFGTVLGHVFRSAAAGAGGAAAAGNFTPPFVNAGAQVTSVVTVADSGGNGYRIAVATGGAQGEVFIADLATHSAAVNWWKIDSASPAPANRLPPGPYLSLAFDPTNERHLYVGTLAGVYGARDLPAFPLGAPPAVPVPGTQAVTWQTFNGGLPLVFVQDMEVCAVTGTLRIATNGRGVFERNIAGSVPAHQVRPVSLLIRNNPIDDGRTYANTLATDPRQGAAVALDLFHSLDIRVDPPRFGWVEPAEPLFRELFAFGEQLEGSEFDDILVHGPPVLGEVNYVYVHVANRGHTPATDVAVHLLFAGGALAAGPPPDLQAGLRAAFPLEPPAGAWSRVGPPEIIGRLEPGTPAVVRFEWTPPLDLLAQTALLAIADSAEDHPNLGALPDDVVANVVQASRHVALRITPVIANPIFLRDGVDDDGQRGTVAWGARSPDIVLVTPPIVGDPNAVAENRDLALQRLGDRIQPPPTQNHLMVRVFNRTSVLVNADVDLYFVPDGRLSVPAQWVKVNTVPMRTGNILGKSWRFTNAVAWTVPAAHAAARTFLFVAIASPVGAQPPKPDHLVEAAPPPVPPGVVVDDDLAAFWTFARNGSFADKVALRAVRRA